MDKISKKWVDEIIDVMTELGGHCQYKDLYESIEERNLINLTNYTKEENWQGQIRQTIQFHSSDSTVYKGKRDYFYSVEGLGKGHWGLRDFIADSSNVDLTEDDESFEEGKKQLTKHICYERNHRVIFLAKQKFKQKHNKLFCVICDFDFEKVYGEIGKDYIEGHHSIPVSDIPQGYRTKPEDIVIVCSNCHKMLHRKRPWLSKDKLKNILNSSMPPNKCV